MTEIEPEEEPTAPVVGPPTVADVTGYLNGTPGVAGYAADEIDRAYRAEKAAQRSVCRVPADDATWPDDLAEALCRRVAHNLSVRQNPLGIKAASGGEFGQTLFRVGGSDAEVKRLEGPHRKRRIR